MKVEGTIRVRTYSIVADAVERGAAYGYQRAHKYTDTPAAETIKEQIASAIMTELCEVLDLDLED